MANSLDDVDDFDFHYHQVEPLTTRLHNLLEDSYTDGFSIPKELIQNADDAGAREVKFLLDERQNEDCREHLIHPNMASLQGPALWVFNDATFSDQDFANLVKLGAGTKKEDASKVGKFGLGFNAVYNLTDVPSFISRNAIALFDPHQRHLPRGNPGMRIDLSLPSNRNRLKALASQFKPFEDVFGCSLQREPFSEYPATLFRLPFRSETQATASDIKQEYYSPEKRRKLLAMLMERAGNLLLFTQHVERVEVFYLPQEAQSPTSMICLMSVTRTSTPVLPLGIPDRTESILKSCTAKFQDYFTRGSGVPDIKMTETVLISLDVRPQATEVCSVEQGQWSTEWRITWASGTNQSARLALKKRGQGYIPLAAAAVPLDDNKILNINNCPFGFYTQGRLFCFLPLPEQIEQPSLPVHLNGTFALNSSRRNLLIHTEESTENQGGDWNAALMSDAVCRAYLLLLESLTDTVGDDYSSYFELWPRSDNILSLLDSFYSSLINGRFQVFPCQEGWLSFHDVRFFDPSFRQSPVGDLALPVVLQLSEDRNFFCDVPYEICQILQKSQQGEDFLKRCLTEDEFYEDVFFPNITSEFWKTPEKVKMRDSLTLHAITKGTDRVKKLVMMYACIPCQASRELRTPGGLVHPQCEAAALFLPEEGRFPQTRNDHGAVDFCQSDCLESLVQMGMAHNDLKPRDVLARARSVRELHEQDKNLSFSRSHLLVDYLASTRSSTNTPRISLFSSEEIDELSKTEFLPILTKPDDWPFPWFYDDLQSELAAPCHLYHSDMTNLVACTQKIFASAPPLPLCLKTSEKSRREVLHTLKLVTQETAARDQTVIAAVKQIQMVAEFQESHEDIQSILGKINEVSRAVYSFLQRCIETNTLGNEEKLLLETLQSEGIIWTGSHFCQPSRLAFKVRLPCPPYLQEVSEVDRIAFKNLFQFLGVREKFGPQDILRMMEEMKDDVGDGQLSDEQVELFCRGAQLLCSALRESSEIDSLSLQQVSLPDKDCILRHVKNLCLRDSSKLELKPGIFFIHETFSPEVAKTLGVSSKKNTIFKSHMKVKSFGQSEKLTNRIKRLLQGYTCDVSIFKEFIQNADDAGATEIRFIKDFRKLGTDSVPDGCKDLQGPALCVYNNADFTSKDIEGIQNLGEGSKGEEMMKTGQFGVGFNAVYHITDVPSFWTRRDGTEQVICVCDPCRLIPNDFQQPGMELEDIDKLKEEYPDLVDGYLGNTFDMSQPATLFRLPLRNQRMASKSAIKKEKMTQTILSKLLKDFMEDAGMCLLFLNNLRKIGIYSTDGCTLETEYEVEMVIDRENSLKKEAHYGFLKNEGDSLIEENLGSDVRGVESLETVLNFTLKDSQGIQEDWVQVSRAGFLDPSEVPWTLQEDWRREHFRLLPRGGVAVKLKRTDLPSAECATSYRQPEPPKTPSRVFCTLPLPVETELPMHINGHFALEHESRRDLWNRKEDSRTDWNRIICTKVIAPAYVKALQQVKLAWFGQRQRENDSPATTAEKLRNFFDLFPKVPIPDSIFWSSLVEAIYQQVINGHQALFPVTRAGSGIITWTTAWKDKGFAGHFVRPPGYVCLPPTQPGQSRKKTQELVEQTASNPALKEVLKQINMKIVEAPYHVFEALRRFGETKMREAIPSTVLQFLRSCTATTPDSCGLKNLPQPLADLELNESHVHLLADFVSKSPSFSSMIGGLPLCLLQSGTLDIFSKDRLTFVTAYYDLIPKRSEEFLHGSLVEIFVRVVDDVPNVLRKFTMKDLADRMSCCLDPKHFRTGRPCSLNTALLPNDKWLQRLWDFLRNCLHREDEKHPVNDTIRLLKEWSLIPCKIGKDNENLLYPVQDRGNVLFLPYVSSRTSAQNKDEAVNKVLEKLPLPVIDRLIISQSFAEKLVASVKNPTSILNILRAFRDSIKLSQSDSKFLLDYFAHNLKKEIKTSDLLKIPMFSTSSGHIISLDSFEVLLLQPEGIPQDGLEVWSQKTKTALLNPLFLPHELHEVLRLDKASNPYMVFWRRLLTTLDRLPQEAVGPHIQYIRKKYRDHLKNEADNIFQILSQTAFIRVDSNKMCKASEFVSPHEIVFKLMCDRSRFPPPPYCEVEWSYFLERSGMVKEVTAQMFLLFARKLEAEGRNTLSPQTLERSRTLVKHLFERKDLSSCGLLNDIRDIRFVRPWSFEYSKGHELLANICPPLVTNRLVSFSESFSSCYWPLLWSTTSILHPHDDPDKYFQTKELQPVVRELMFEQKVPIEQFKNHVRNICQALTSSPCDLLHSSDGRSQVEWLFSKIYQFLTVLQSKNFADTDFFKNMPVIFDSNNSCLLNPEQVVIGLRSEEAVEGWLFRAPVNYDLFYDLFKALGVACSVTADHYTRVLSKLHLAQKNLPLNHDRLQACKKAVQCLFRCLAVSRDLNEEVIYLPNEQLCLKPSSFLIFSNNDSSDELLKKRLHSCSDRFFGDLTHLGIQSDHPWRTISFLPEGHKMTRLSEITTEVVPEWGLAIKEIGPLAQALKRKLTSVDYVNGITRLVCHKHMTKALPQAPRSRQEVGKMLTSIEIFEIKDFQTVLVIDKQEVTGSEAKHLAFEDERFAHRVFVDSSASISDQDVVLTLSEVVIKTLDEDLSEFKSLLKEMLRCQDVQALLDQHNISYFRQSDTCRPGCYVHTDDICLLNNSVTSVYVDGEYVAVEVYDPLIDNKDFESKLRASEGQEFSKQELPEENVNHEDMIKHFEDPQRDYDVQTMSSRQVFVYARVLGKVNANEEQTVRPPCCLSYRLDIGYERIMIASGIRVYKIPTYYDEDSSVVTETSSSQAASYDPTDEAVVSDVKGCLEVAWPLLGDRRSQLVILKRLCLQWHLGLNIQNVCPEAVKSLEATPTFCQRLHDRSQLYDRQILASMGEKSDPSDQQKRKNPQPGEARRWLRQAFADLTTAKSTSGGNNWHCLMCHQAVEKALKAVLFHHDAEDKLLHPVDKAELKTLAMAVSDEELMGAVEVLEGLTGEAHKMLYPSVQWGPQIPAQLYTPDTARAAHSQVETILTMVASLIK
ncbi:hypothetical protein C0Q70_21251 [Pomacea canaliculata]|uniref:HEPN domain-containing protein n=1 Tax=Pomacea canaliculata TaxID=400727 RepID=A0A2T7NC09_POMCA|nr:sacsin-like [Pomacea canaliculata]PVD18701.1 hypothetical protein C0Q70_21251 [Pomacea canaliculata]